jgi:hypothetical protein
MKNKLYYFVFFDSLTQRSETLEVQAKSFAEATPGAFVYRVSLNKRHAKSNWDIISVKSKLA